MALPPLPSASTARFHHTNNITLDNNGLLRPAAARESPSVPASALPTHTRCFSGRSTCCFDAPKKEIGKRRRKAPEHAGGSPALPQIRIRPSLAHTLQQFRSNSSPLQSDYSVPHQCQIHVVAFIISHVNVYRHPLFALSISRAGHVSF